MKTESTYKVRWIIQHPRGLHVGPFETPTDAQAYLDADRRGSVEPDGRSVEWLVDPAPSGSITYSEIPDDTGAAQ